MPDASIHAAAHVVEILGGPLYRVRLPNDKVVLAHLSKSLEDARAGFTTGTMVRVELTPFDFDHARILGPLDAT